jgi:hypothetical protein
MVRKQLSDPSEHELEFKIKLPADIGERIRAKAQREDRPLNRIITDELREYPVLKQTGTLAAAVEALAEQNATLAEQTREMKITLARYGARITWLDLTDHLLEAMDLVTEALETDSPSLPAAMEALRAGLLTARTLGPEVKRKLKKP